MNLLIKNGRVIDPANHIDGILDILIENDKILQVAENITEDADHTIDAAAHWVVPGLIDLHVHLRQPGFEYKEDILSGSQSAAAGGFTTICAMPNTNPVTDCVEIVDFIRKEAADCAVVNVLPISSITKSQKGLALAPIDKMVQAGICAVSEDGYTVEDSKLLKDAMTLCKSLDIPVFSHCEDLALVANGVINEGQAAEKFGFPPISKDSEEVIVGRDLILAKSTGVRLHLCHVSTKGSVNLIEDAKKRGVFVTAEATPHHFTLSDSEITEDDGNYKMNPPLRSPEDLQEIRQALKDNIIDIIATDHAPHHESEKKLGFLKSANGIVGLETAVPLAISELVQTNLLSPTALIEKMSVNPAKVLGIEKGHLSPGAVADITIIDPNGAYTIDKNKFLSKGKNSPFHGRKVYGKVMNTIVSGKIVYKRER